VPITRAEDGLALSSRNGYLSAENRAAAPAIYKNLKAAEQALLSGDALPKVLEDMKSALTGAGFVVDYVEARTTELQKVEQFNEDRKIRCNPPHRQPAGKIYCVLAL